MSHPDDDGPSVVRDSDGVGRRRALTDRHLDLESNNPLALASQQLPGNQEQLAKHQEGQFEWLLSIPASSFAKGPGCTKVGDEHDDEALRRSRKKLYFGCNLVHRTSRPERASGHDGKAANMYTLLATPIKEVAMEGRVETQEAETMSANQLPQSEAAVGVAETRVEEPDAAQTVETTQDAEPKAEAVAENLGASPPSRPTSRIEDSVEALDKLEEDIEALTEAVQAPAQASKPEATKTTPLRRTGSVKPSSSTSKSSSVQRSSSVRKPASADAEKGTGGATPGTTSRKPLAKSSKPPTVPAFELPGEAVARRLKEQREARRSQQITPEQAAAVAAAYSPSRPHVKSTKPPTRPTFELPGEAISRKKREAHQAKLRAQEEEERKRREFKARPIRASLTPSSVPRETRASLARLEKQRQAEGSADSTTTTTTAKKRQSMTAAPPATSTSASTTRGRGSAADPGKQAAGAASRATSVSTASGSIRSGGKRSTVSAEEVAQQKQRGKEIFARENGYAAERERERREREQTAKAAREAAAARSRELSRKWAEKQQAKKEKEKEKTKAKAGGEETGGGESAGKGKGDEQVKVEEEAKGEKKGEVNGEAKEEATEDVKVTEAEMAATAA